MTVECVGAASWVVQLTDSEAEKMGCRRGSMGSDLADMAAELTGCEGHCTAQIYYGKGEMLLFLKEREGERTLVHFPDLEAMLGAAQYCRNAQGSTLYAAEDGYILSFAACPPLSVWDFGHPAPYGSIGGAAALIEIDAVQKLCRVFAL